MSIIRTKNIPTILIGALICLVGFIGLIALINDNSNRQAPMRRMRIIIDVDRREELFVQLQKFAEKHDFKILIRDVDVTPDGIFVEMNRNDLDILAGDVPNSPTKIDLRFYERDPSYPTSKEIVDALFNDLMSFTSEIPNITISNEN